MYSSYGQLYNNDCRKAYKVSGCQNISKAPIYSDIYDNLNETITKDSYLNNGIAYGRCNSCFDKKKSERDCKKCKLVKETLVEMYISGCNNKMSFLCDKIKSSEKQNIIYYYYYLDGEYIRKGITMNTNNNILVNYILKTDYTINLNNMMVPTLEVSFYDEDSKQKRKYYIDKGLLSATFPFFRQVLEFNRNNKIDKDTNIEKPIKIKTDVKEHIFLHYIKLCMSNTILENIISTGNDSEIQNYDIDDIFALLSLCSLYPIYDNTSNNTEAKKYDYAIGFAIHKWIRKNIGKITVDINNDTNEIADIREIEFEQKTIIEKLLSPPNNLKYYYDGPVIVDGLRALPLPTEFDVSSDYISIVNKIELEQKVNIERFLLSSKKYNVIEICEMCSFWKIYIAVKFIEKINDYFSFTT